MVIKWKHKIGAQGGQGVKSQKGKAPAVVNINTEMDLKISLQSSTDSLDEAVKEIIDSIDGLDKVSLVISGSEATLKGYVKTIQEIVAAHGNQPSLEAYTKTDSAVIPLES